MDGIMKVEAAVIVTIVELEGKGMKEQLKSMPCAFSPSTIN